MSAAKISAFVVCYNRAEVLGTCLRGLHFADELIVVDKSSTDGCRAIAEALTERVITVPWTATVEETRRLALALCRHEWILFADDDECFGTGTETAIRTELGQPRADIYEFALRHYILGRHDPGAYYWPEHHVRLFRRGAVTFAPTVHAGIGRQSDRVFRFPHEADVCIHHLSNPDVGGWIEKTNRYTANPDRAGVSAGPEGLAAFARQRIDHWMGCSTDASASGYREAAAVLRAVYDMVDALKAWETHDGVSGAERLRQAAQAIDERRADRFDGPSRR